MTNCDLVLPSRNRRVLCRRPRQGARCVRRDRRRQRVLGRHRGGRAVARGLRGGRADARIRRSRARRHRGLDAEYVAVIDGDGSLDPATCSRYSSGWRAVGRTSPSAVAAPLQRHAGLGTPGSATGWRSAVFPGGAVCSFTTSRQPGYAGATTSSVSVWRTAVSAIPSSFCCAPGALAGPWQRSTSPTTRGPPHAVEGFGVRRREPSSRRRLRAGAVVRAAVVVLAKAPVPGVAKTRLAAVVGDRRAADLAAAALLDTLESCRGLHGRIPGGRAGWRPRRCQPRGGTGRDPRGVARHGAGRRGSG